MSADGTRVYRPPAAIIWEYALLNGSIITFKIMALCGVGIFLSSKILILSKLEEKLMI